MRTDGSRIEGSHAAWNRLSHGTPSSLETINARASDHVLRRNVRVELNSKEFPPSAFIESTYGSHHLALTNKIAVTWNSILSKHAKKAVQAKFLPVLPSVDSGESFGIVESKHISTFGGMLEPIKEEPEEEDELIVLSERADSEREEICKELNIDLRELYDVLPEASNR